MERQSERYRAIRLLPVASSAIVAVGYAARTRQLVIDFASGSRYVYAGVPPKVFRELMAAESKGRYFQEHIRDAYAFDQDG